MRFNINLATQPYEAAREYRRRLGALVIALGVITAALLAYIIQQRMVSRQINAQISEVEQELASLDREKAQAQAILTKPANRVVADQSSFLNQLFARKALSWTRIFAEMENIMPYSIHVVSMKPEYTADNQLVLHMVVATDSRERAVELVQRMEKSSHFRQAQVVAENVLNTGAGDQGAGGGSIQFEIASVYLPGPDEANDAGPSNDSGPQVGVRAKAAGRPRGAVQAQNLQPTRGRH